MLVTGDMISCRCEGGVNQAVAPDDGTIVLNGRRPLAQPRPEALPGDMLGISILCQPEPETLVDIRVERCRFILWCLTDCEAVPHQAGECRLEKLHAARDIIAKMLFTDQIEDELVRA